MTLLLSKSFEGFEVWTKQDCEESLGKSEAIGLKIVINEAVKLGNYHAPKDAAQDRVFLLVQRKGEKPAAAEKAALLRRAGYPVAVLTLPAKAAHSRYMQFLHYVVFGLGYVRQMNFITQPSVELYKAITARIHFNGAVGQTEEMARMKASPKQAKWRGGVTVHYDRLNVEAEGASAADIYASILRKLAADGSMEYGEMTFFGDSRYSEKGRALRRVLDRAAASIFPAALKMPADVGEGPGMNHSYHEMIIGHGKCFSTVLLCEKSEKLEEADYNAEYHRAQWLATQMALAERGRNVAAITLKDLEAPTVAALEEFFKQVAAALKRKR